jgi:hypothetical protein
MMRENIFLYKRPSASSGTTSREEARDQIMKRGTAAFARAFAQHHVRSSSAASLYVAFAFGEMLFFFVGADRCVVVRPLDCGGMEATRRYGALPPWPTALTVCTPLSHSMFRRRLARASARPCCVPHCSLSLCVRVCGGQAREVGGGRQAECAACSSRPRIHPTLTHSSLFLMVRSPLSTRVQRASTKERPHSHVRDRRERRAGVGHNGFP